MHKAGKIADGLASWLQFEKRCGRSGLFSESYLAHPIGQLLRTNYGRNAKAECHHPVLANSTAGRRPSIDFLVPEGTKNGAVAIETKWVSKSPTLLRDILRDIIRLDLLVPEHASDALMILAGRRDDCEKLFGSKKFTRERSNKPPITILPTGRRSKSTLRFDKPTKWRTDLYRSVLEPFIGYEVSKKITVLLSGPFPREALKSDYIVYIWRLVHKEEVGKFSVLEPDQ